MAIPYLLIRIGSGAAAVTPPTTQPTIPPGGGWSYLHQLEHWWAQIRAERRAESLKKRKKKTEKELLLEQLDEMIAELKARVIEEPIEERAPPPSVDISRITQYADAEFTRASINAQIAFARAIMREMEEEDEITLILMSIH